ncbi:15554_t:CDS:2, partial [Funneliformis mosseae]
IQSTFANTYKYGLGIQFYRSVYLTSLLPQNVQESDWLKSLRLELKGKQDFDIYELPYGEQKLSALRYFRCNASYSVISNLSYIRSCTSSHLGDDIAKLIKNQRDFKDIIICGNSLKKWESILYQHNNLTRITLQRILVSFPLMNFGDCGCINLVQKVEHIFLFEEGFEKFINTLLRHSNENMKEIKFFDDFRDSKYLKDIKGTYVPKCLLFNWVRFTQESICA